MGQNKTITDEHEAARELAQLFNTHGRAVFFGGAGVSTASGIPDFRSVDGLYHQQFAYPPETMLSHDFYVEHPEEFFEFYRTKMIALGAKPNRCHIKLAELEQAGKLSAVVTQNIDGLHQAAGSKRVYELHGSVHRNICQRCGVVYPAEWVLAQAEKSSVANAGSAQERQGQAAAARAGHAVGSAAKVSRAAGSSSAGAAEGLTGGVPVCEKCGGRVKPDVVLYGENLNEHVLMGAVEAIAQADLLVVGGTSLVVYPAAGLIRYFQGDKLVIVNRDPTPQDALADVLISCDIAQAFDF